MCGCLQKKYAFFLQMSLQWFWLVWILRFLWMLNSRCLIHLSALFLLQFLCSCIGFLVYRHLEYCFFILVGSVLSVMLIHPSFLIYSPSPSKVRLVFLFVQHFFIVCFLAQPYICLHIMLQFSYVVSLLCMVDILLLVES